jgi:hypothetical protein
LQNCAALSKEIADAAPRSGWIDHDGAVDGVRRYTATRCHDPDRRCCRGERANGHRYTRSHIASAVGCPKHDRYKDGIRNGHPDR